MEMMIDWLGPFAFVPQPGLDCVFNRPEAAGPGLYLWTVECQGGFMVNYVGEAGQGKKTLRSRLIENVQWSYAGNDGGVSDPVHFREGRRVLLREFDFPEFLADYAQLSSVIHEVYRSYRVFIAPLSVQDHVRRFVEAGIIRTLRAAGGTIAEFLYNKRLIGSSPEPLVARFRSRHRFHGLPEAIEC